MFYTLVGVNSHYSVKKKQKKNKQIKYSHWCVATWLPLKVQAQDIFIRALKNISYLFYGSANGGVPYLIPVAIKILFFEH